MDEKTLKAEVLELLKKHARQSEDARDTAAVHFTEAAFDDMIEDIVGIMKQHAKQGEQ